MPPDAHHGESPPGPPPPTLRRCAAYAGERLRYIAADKVASLAPAPRDDPEEEPRERLDLAVEARPDRLSPARRRERAALHDRSHPPDEIAGSRRHRAPIEAALAAADPVGPCLGEA